MKIKDFYLIDTPGLVDYGNILNKVTKDRIKRISVKKFIMQNIEKARKHQGYKAFFENQTCRWTAQKTLIEYNYVSADKY